MIAPINYMLDVKNPFESTLQGAQTGLGLAAMMTKQQEAQRQLELQKTMQADLAALAGNKNATGQDYAAIMTKYPQLSEHFKRSWDVLNSQQQQNKLQQATQVYAALHTGKPQIASDLLRNQAQAMRNSGQEEEAKASETMAQWIDMNPDSAKTTAGLMLSSLMGPDKFAETFAKLGGEQREADLHPDAVRKGRADATTAEVKAKYAESDALLDLEKKGWDIKGIQADIDFKKQSTRIAAMNAAIGREANGLKRQELQLKVEEAVRERDSKIREKAAEVESARSNMDNMLNTVDRILQNPRLDDVIGTFEGRMPAITSDESADAIALIETLKSQSFLAQIPNIKGMGALSNAEGEKLQAALQNLDRVQSEKQFRASLSEAQRLILKARKNIAQRYGVPETIPDRPAAAAPQMPPGFKVLGKE